MSRRQEPVGPGFRLLLWAAVVLALSLVSITIWMNLMPPIWPAPAP